MVASVFSHPEGLAVTCWHHFIHLVENERRVPCSFMILSHLARFLLLLVCLVPRAWKTEEKKKCSVFSPSAFPRLSFLCCRYTKTPTHINICLHTKIFVCGRQPPPRFLPSAYKNKTAQSLCCSICHLANLSVTPFLTPTAALCFLDWTVHCVQSESAHRREKGEGRLLGQELGAVLSTVKLWHGDEWPVMRGWWLKT